MLLEFAEQLSKSEQTEDTKKLMNGIQELQERLLKSERFLDDQMDVMKKCHAHVVSTSLFASGNCAYLLLYG